MIFEIIGLACLAHLATEFFTTHMEFNYKPFNCNLCMGWWVALFPMVVHYGLEGFLGAAVTGIASETIYRLLNRI